MIVLDRARRLMVNGDPERDLRVLLAGRDFPDRLCPGCPHGIRRAGRPCAVPVRRKSHAPGDCAFSSNLETDENRSPQIGHLN
jgi:hypothetical protein